MGFSLGALFEETQKIKCTYYGKKYVSPIVTSEELFICKNNYYLGSNIGFLSPRIFLSSPEKFSTKRRAPHIWVVILSSSSSGSSRPPRPLTGPSAFCVSPRAQSHTFRRSRTQEDSRLVPSVPSSRASLRSTWSSLGTARPFVRFPRPCHEGGPRTGPR